MTHRLSGEKGAARFGAVPALLALACGGQDPILDRADELAAEAGVSPSASPAGGGSPAPGRPTEPAPGIPDEPPPGGIEVKGPSALLRGTVDVPGWKGGAVRIDVFDGDQQAAATSAGQRPRVVAMARLEKPGAFEVRVPSSAPSVWVGAYADEDANGRPDPDDPAGWYPGNPVATDQDRVGIDMKLARGAVPAAP